MSYGHAAATIRDFVCVVREAFTERFDGAAKPATLPAGSAQASNGRRNVACVLGRFAVRDAPGSKAFGFGSILVVDSAANEDARDSTVLVEDAGAAAALKGVAGHDEVVVALDSTV